MGQPATDPAPRSGGTWRSIRQEVQSQAMSKKGRRRQRLEWFKYGAAAVAVGLVIFGIFSVVRIWEDGGSPGILSGRQPPLASPVLVTDGVITRDWVKRTLAVPAGATLVSLDLRSLRERLLVTLQIRNAVLTRSYPDSLVVTLQERSPVARLQAEDSTGKKQLLVARDGVVYEGIDYPAALVDSLPWLDGCKLAREGKGFAPIAGMEEAADLLASAQNEAPWLYRDWQVISLARLETHGEFVVKARGPQEITFSKARDYRKQIAQLDYILDQARDRLETIPVRVNLAISRQATVQFDRSAEELAPPVARPKSASNNRH